jgi:hypothetical protein
MLRSIPCINTPCQYFNAKINILAEQSKPFLIPHCGHKEDSSEGIVMLKTSIA